MVLQASLPPPPTAESYRYDEKSNFTGGLNFRADQFNLGETESPELLILEAVFVLGMVLSVLILLRLIILVFILMVLLRV